MLLDLDKAFLTEIFELFGTILKMDIREPGAASSPPAGKVRGPGAEKIMSNQATVTIMYADAKAAEDVIKSYVGQRIPTANQGSSELELGKIKIRYGYMCQSGKKDGSIAHNKDWFSAVQDFVGKGLDQHYFENDAYFAVCDGVSS